MSVREGMDVERVRSIAAQLGHSGERIRGVRGAGTGSMRVLDGVWSGADVEEFSRGWDEGASSLEAAASALTDLQRDLLRQADDQDRASGGGGSGGGGGGGRDPLESIDDLFDDLFGGDDDGDDDDGGWSLPNPIDGLRDAWDRGTEVARDAWDWAGERGRDLVEWGRGGLEWLGDRGRDLLDAGRTFWDEQVVSRWDAGMEALARLGPSITNFAEQFTQIFTEGRWPRFHEVAASAILLLGRTGGLFANVVTGEDHGIFDSGEGVVTDREAIAADPTEPGRIPTDLNSLMDIQSSTYDLDKTDADNRHVRITEVRQPDGSSAYIVTVPGTNGLTEFPGSITGGDEAFDNTSNLELQAGQRSASMEAVMAAMEEAGIPPDAPVMLQGHSQGGMVTGELVQDAEFMEQYNVTHMITQGSPNDSRTIPEGVQTLALEHTNDPVPKVDLGDSLLGPPVALPLPGPLPPIVLPATPIPNVDPALAGSGDHVSKVVMDPGPGVEPLSGGANDRGAHDYIDYANTVERELEAGNQALVDYANDPGLDIFLTDDPSDVAITEYETGRR